MATSDWVLVGSTILTCLLSGLWYMLTSDMRTLSHNYAEVSKELVELKINIVKLEARFDKFDKIYDILSQHLTFGKDTL